MEKITAEIKDQTLLLEDIYSMTIIAPSITESARCGQFLSLYSRDGSRLLPRPISICEIDKEQGTIRIVYRIAGKGTREFSTLTAGDKIEVNGPIGNGYVLDTKHPILMGGGIGIPPMLALAEELNNSGIPKEDISVILGYRDDTFLLDEFNKVSTVYISSDSGKNGIKGNVIDAAKHYEITGDMIYSCGPTPMLRGVKAFAQEKGIKAQLSLEERMACGIGACLACVCKSTQIDDHSNVKNKRVCVDGPVFFSEEVEL